MSNLTLFDIAQEYRSITDVLMDSGCDEQTLNDTLEAEAWPLELKAQNYAFVVRNLQATVDAIKEAEKQMAARRKAMENRAQYLLNRLQTGMEIAGVSKLECPHFRISVTRNPPSVEVWDEKQIPAQYMRQPEPPPPVPDKRAIADAIKAGREIPGATLQHGTRLDIR